ncbi:MAG: hypothetical protein KF696_07810 [Planctomycetes bacterium]|nr:hypothetical protein [Planctomycetota bacterium]MCW8135458.1 hypothetical protein [Planctomycetota bacterium]
MDLTAVPYLLVSRELDFGFSNERVYLCLCLIDHLVMGIGLSRDEAMRGMMNELEEKYGDDFEDSIFARN